MNDEYYILEYTNIVHGVSGRKYCPYQDAEPSKFYRLEDAREQANRLFVMSPGTTLVTIRKILDQEVEVVSPPKDPVLDKAISSVQEVLATLTEEQKKELWERLNK
jgi:hypothetical protein